MSHTVMLRVTVSHIECSTSRHSCKWKVSHTESLIGTEMEGDCKKEKEGRLTHAVEV
jgi:hypothetical protein